jgi:Arc-like DNA binding domain
MVRKSRQLRAVMTRIPEGLRRKLEREAEQNGRSMNAEIIHRLESSFQRETEQLFARALDAVLRDVQDIKQQAERLTAPPPTTLLELGHRPAPAPIVIDVRDVKAMLKTFLQQSANRTENPK